MCGVLRIVLTILVAIGAGIAAPASCLAQKRIALLIGNKDYKSGVGALLNPINDTRIVGEALRAIGFEVLKPVHNARRTDILLAIHDFAAKLQAAGSDAVGFLYYSGHGIASGGENYLIPVDVEEPSSRFLSAQGVRQGEILAILRGEAPNAAHYVVLDACRNNLQGTRGGKGFAPVGQQSGVLVAFATEPGKTASDTGQGSGPYAAALATELVRPGQTDLIMFHRVRVAVMDRTNGDQVPWTEDGIQRRDRVVFGRETRTVPMPTTAVSEAERTWPWVKDSTDEAVLENFIRQFGDTSFGAMARSRLDSLRRQKLAVAAPPPAPPSRPPEKAQPSSPTKGFVFDAKANDEIARKLNIPLYFAVPESARGELPAVATSSDRLVDFRHPEGRGKTGDVGLRVVVAKRAGVAGRLGKSGLVQTGDLLLTFRAEWGGAGAYPNLQMGISHTGIAYVKDGAMHNLDNPLTEEYLGSGMRSTLDGEHYRTLRLIHVIRPRNLTDAQRANLVDWSTRLATTARKVYPKEISFNQDYNAPKYKPGQPFSFVKHLGQSALSQNPSGSVDMFCSEFAWSLLALRDCNPAKDGEAFQGPRVPSCIKPILEPMRATGDYISSRGRLSSVGLTEGPLLIIDALNLPDAERDTALRSVFIENRNATSKLGVGHRQVVETMNPKFASLERYYLGSQSKGALSSEARQVSNDFQRSLVENYSPASFLINTLLPKDNANRTMDYVATILLE